MIDNFYDGELDLKEFYTSVNRFGNSILYRGYDSSGLPVTRKDKFSPTLYLRSDVETPHRTLEGHFVKPKKFETMKDAKNFIETYGEVDNITVYGNTNYITQYIHSKFPDDIGHFDRSLVNVGTLDLEMYSGEGFPYPDQAKHPILSMGLKLSKTDTYYVWGMQDYDVSDPEIAQCNIVYTKCEDEVKMLLNFLDFWNSPENTPDILTGWHTKLFDITYLVNRVFGLLGEDAVKKLSPFGIVSERKVKTQHGTSEAYELYGIQQLDYMELFQKFGVLEYGPQENFKLDNISNVVLGANKLSFDEVSSLHELYESNFQKFITYMIRDVELVDRMEKQLGYITLAMTMGFRGGVNFVDVFGTTAIWESIIFRNLASKNIVTPPSNNNVKVPYAGGYVKDPKVGLHRWVVSFDLNSLYPNIIAQWNISPETISDSLGGGSFGVEACLNGMMEEQDPNFAIAINGVRFSRDKQGFMPEIIVNYYNDRVSIRGKMITLKKELELVESTDTQKRSQLDQEIKSLNTQQLSIKLLLNSLYGACGTPYFKYFDLRIAEAITLTGQLVIQWTEKEINKAINKILETNNIDYVVAMDTDSIYLNMGPIVDKFNPQNPVDFLDKICGTTFQKILDNTYKDIFKKFNCFDSRMKMKRESIADTGIWTAKKRYILNVLDNEGVRYAEPQLKIMGIEAIKSSTPAECRRALKELFKVIIQGSELNSQKFIQNFKTEFMALSPEEVSFPRGVNELKKYKDKTTIFKKGTPINSRGSLLYNHHIKKNSLDKKYNEIQVGEKIKFCYLKTPNPIKQNVIAYPDFLPPELNLHKYVDYETQFQKTFVKPIQPIFDAIGWKVKRTVSLEDFFE
jgi:DNA polymerase elongation subunit (family B)